ncbi:l1 transposable element-related [Holotrichia oblita]|uniref:L1 transposable element-related n=1 Tax=Holotrichia oblita TaxID=644536 RepID=A0ACB9SQL0_HOLOL|nr:l1 transposable element-related [Holotrichia oblita]
MPEDRVLRADAMVLKTVEAVLKSEELLNSISNMIAEKLNQKIEALTNVYQQKVSQLEEKLHNAHKTIDSLEQYSRRNSLRIHGLPVIANENTDEVVMKFCKEKLQFEVKKEMIDCSHRLGKKENRSKPLLVKFVTRNIKQEIDRKKSKLKRTKIVIREDLTPNESC